MLHADCTHAGQIYPIPLLDFAKAIWLYAEGNILCAGVLCRLSIQCRALELRNNMWRQLSTDNPSRLLELKPPCSGQQHRHLK